MAFASRLRPDSATMVGLLTAAGVVLIYQNALPNLTDIRAANPDNSDVEHNRKMAAWESAALVAVVFMVSRDLNSYLISGAALVGVDYVTKHNNSIHPATGKFDSSTESIASTETYPVENYQAQSDSGDYEVY